LRSDQGVHQGVARSSANIRSEKPVATKAPRVIYTLRVYSGRPAEMSRAIEAQKIRRALQLAMQEFGSHNGKQLAAEIRDGYSLDKEAPIVIGEYEYSPNAPP
jgi:hypothetical protein